MNPRFRFDLPSPAAVTLPVELPLPAPIVRPGFSAEQPSRNIALDLADPLPVDQVFVPDGYEAAYAYPLIVWLLPAEAGRLELHRLMSQVSNRNHLGLALRLEAADLQAVESGMGADEVLAANAARLLQTVRRLRRVHHVHSERVYLAGFGSAGAFALALGLTKPEWFAGLAAFGSRMPEASQLLSRLDEIRGLRVLLGAGQRDRHVPTGEVSRVSRLLQSAGLRVCHRLYESGHELTRSMLVELDRWVMKDILEPANV